jgi:alpha-L-rhamnosidase
MKKSNLCALAIPLLAFYCQFPQQKGIEFLALNCGYLEAPLDIDMDHFRFSWIIKSPACKILHTGYEIIVSKEDGDFSEDAITYKSGLELSPNSVNGPFGGERLASQTTYYWKVRIRDQHGRGLSSIACLAA